MTKCVRCGTSGGRRRTIAGKVYQVCDSCEDNIKEIIDSVVKMYLEAHNECFIGFRAKDIPELKRLFAQSESEDIRKMVKFLEDVEADIWPKEVVE